MHSHFWAVSLFYVLGFFSFVSIFFSNRTAWIRLGVAATAIAAGGHLFFLYWYGIPPVWLLTGVGGIHLCLILASVLGLCQFLRTGENPQTMVALYILILTGLAYLLFQSLEMEPVPQVVHYEHVYYYLKNLFAMAGLVLAALSILYAWVYLMTSKRTSNELMMVYSGAVLVALLGALPGLTGLEPGLAGWILRGLFAGHLVYLIVHSLPGSWVSRTRRKIKAGWLGSRGEKISRLEFTARYSLGLMHLIAWGLLGYLVWVEFSDSRPAFESSASFFSIWFGVVLLGEVSLSIVKFREAWGEFSRPGLVTQAIAGRLTFFSVAALTTSLVFSTLWSGTSRGTIEWAPGDWFLGLTITYLVLVLTWRGLGKKSHGRAAVLSLMGGVLIYLTMGALWGV